MPIPGFAIQGLLALLAALVVYSLHPVKRWHYRHIPGPRPWPLIGNLVTVLTEGQDNAFVRWAKQYGSPFLFWLGAVPVVMVDDPDLARKVMMRPHRHKIFSLHVGAQKTWDYNNLVFINGEKWKVTRNAWQPFFSHASVSRHGQLMADSAGKLCTQLRNVAESGQEVDIWRAAGRMTLDVVGTTAFGVDFNTLEQPEQLQGSRRRLSSTPAARLVWALQIFFDLFGLANLYFACFFLFPELEGGIKWMANHLPNATFKQELEARWELEQVGSELVQQAVAASKASGTSSPRPSMVDPGSFLVLILPTIGKMGGGEVLDDAWASDQAATFILAGYETTANAIAFTIYLLASNPGAEHEARLLAELDAYGLQRMPSLEDLECGALPFAQAVVQESLRLYPPGSTAVREANKGMVLGGLAIPAGSAVQVNIFSMHRNERYWRDPLAFKPERFVAGTPEAAEVIADAYKPFGDGSRKCIGYRFALLEAVLTVVKLYQQFTFRLLPGQNQLKVRTLLTLGPTDGVQVTVHSRS